MRHRLFKRSLNLILKGLLVLLGLPLCYLAGAWLLSQRTMNRATAKQAPAMHIYLLSNGIHTDLVLPVVSQEINWRQWVHPSRNPQADTTLPYVAFGWGDKDFYLETPTWADLKIATALKAAFRPSASAVHVTYYPKLKTGKYCRRVPVSVESYRKLAEYIKRSFQTHDGKPVPIPAIAAYGKNDAFYEGTSAFHLFFTCNTWTNEALKTAGLPAVLWTPFDDALLELYGP